MIRYEEKSHPGIDKYVKKARIISVTKPILLYTRSTYRCKLFRIESFGNSPHSPFLSGKLFVANEFNITNIFKVYIVRHMIYTEMNRKARPQVTSSLMSTSV